MNTNMVEATRLTRSGRLADAMALLRGHQVTTPAADLGSRPAPDLKQGARIIDMVPPLRGANGAWTAPRSEEITSAAGAEQALSAKLPHTEAVRDLMERLGIVGLTSKLSGSGSQKHAPSATIPEGARFEEHSFANEAGGGATSCTFRAATTARQFRSL